MVQATPWTRTSDFEGKLPRIIDRNLGNWNTLSGYQDKGTSIDENPLFLGMAHSALSGAGSGELGELRITPPGMLNLLNSQTFASPGFFATTVFNETQKFRIATTASPRGAVHLAG